VPGLSNSFEDVFGSGVFEKGDAVVATEGDEVELAGGLAAFETQWHGRILAGAIGKAFELHSNAHSCERLHGAPDVWDG
jgi:hypothetical protein